MRIYKFGGASVKDANGVKNVAKILQLNSNQSLVLVISAMGKMTNAFEELVAAVLSKNEVEEKLDFIKNYHQEIINSLFDDSKVSQKKVDALFLELKSTIENLQSEEYDFVYDQLVCFGELLSTTIVSCYFDEVGISNSWKDVRKLIATDNTYRDAKIDWELTEKQIQDEIDTDSISLVQGFLGGNSEGETTTLGREGSDYTAGIFAYCLNAEDVSIWKDVDGVLNADPRVFESTTLLEQISYEETIEMAFYGASVIHPKTIQPLQSKEIPLWVKSFVNPKAKGTKVSRGVNLHPLVPCYIVKKNQILLSVSTKDFSFVVEDNISYLFKLLHKYQLKVSLIQNSAISFSVCVDNKFNHFDTFVNEIESLFKVRYVKDVELYTIRHFTDSALDEIQERGVSLLTQTTQETTQIVVKSTS